MIWPTNTVRELSPHQTIVKLARDYSKQIITASLHLVKAIPQEDTRVSHPITQPQIMVMHFLRQLDKDSQRLFQIIQRLHTLIRIRTIVHTIIIPHINSSPENKTIISRVHKIVGHDHISIQKR